MFERAELDNDGLPRTVDPSTIALVAHVKNNTRRIRQYLASLQSRVKSEHLLIQLFAGLVYQGKGNYEDVEWHCRRRVASLGSALRLISSNQYGQLHQGEFLPYQDELISLVAHPIDPTKDWRDIVTARYLWHDYTNLNWELGDHSPKGISIIEINLVALLWVHLKARQFYLNTEEVITEPVMVERHMIVPMLDSFMNIAFFNHHRYHVIGRPIPREFQYTSFPRPPLSALAQRGAREKQRVFLAQRFTPVEILYNIPQPFTVIGELGDARSLVEFPPLGSTLQATWHLNLVNWQLALYCFQYNRDLMTKYYSGLRREIRGFLNLRVLEKLPQSLQTHYWVTLFQPLQDIIGDD